MKYPNVSIIVPTFNNQEVLQKALNGLLKLSYPSKYEIIVINDGSTDKTKKMLKEKFSDKKKIKIFNIPRSGVCVARNTGIKKSKYSIIVNMDHDCIPEKNWLKKMAEGFSSPKIGIVNAFGAFGGTSTAFRRKVLEEVNYYDEHYFYYREDTDLTFKILEKGYEMNSVKAEFKHDHKIDNPKNIFDLIKFFHWRLKNHMNDVLLYKKHPNKLTEDFLGIKFGFLINPVKDFKTATGTWDGKGRFKLSSPRGIVFLKNKTPIHTLIIFFLGICYVLAVKFFRLIGSIKHRKLLI